MHAGVGQLAGHPFGGLVLVVFLVFRIFLVLLVSS
jgi:hypothetical protein